MSYYDYEHFWTPDEVCGQKNEPVETTKLSSHMKQFLTKMWHEVFFRKDGESNSISSTVQDEIDSRIDN